MSPSMSMGCLVASADDVAIDVDGLFEHAIAALDAALALDGGRARLLRADEVAIDVPVLCGHALDACARYFYFFVFFLVRSHTFSR